MTQVIVCLIEISRKFSWLRLCEYILYFYLSCKIWFINHESPIKNLWKRLIQLLIRRALSHHRSQILFNRKISLSITLILEIFVLLNRPLSRNIIVSFVRINLRSLDRIRWVRTREILTWVRHRIKNHILLVHRTTLFYGLRFQPIYILR